MAAALLTAWSQDAILAKSNNQTRKDFPLQKKILEPQISKTSEGGSTDRCTKLFRCGPPASDCPQPGEPRCPSVKSIGGRGRGSFGVSVADGRVRLRDPGRLSGTKNRRRRSPAPH
ncbi:hypothetical protein E5288_WYG009093 [Bos mutus]|uniref:Uncharacterized protein n=1 Tax=Bos mutus TaxID=72004 RepID=A0A6B0QVE6_9CETA|nr:hypothetical protein [Bos mutus]